MQAVSIPEDRSMVVPPGCKVITDYVPIEDVVLACRDRMDIAAVEKAMQRRMAIAPSQPWPCPVGAVREDGRYVLHDGRHDYLAALALGCSHILVAWVDGAPQG